MINAVYCEFYKLKKSFFYLVLAAVIIFLPATLCFGWFLQGQVVTWNHYIDQVEQMSCLLMNIVMYTMIGAYIFTREFTCNTAQTLFSYPVSRVKIFISKFIVTVVLIAAVHFLQIVATILGGLLLPHEALTKEILLNHLRLNLGIAALEYAILPLGILVALLSRNIIMPTVYAGLVTVLNMLILGAGIEKVMKYAPIVFAEIYYTNSFKTNKGAVEFVQGASIPDISIIVAIITFIVGTLLCIVHYVKNDID